MRVLLYLALWTALCIVSVIAIDPGLHVLITAAGATFTAFVSFQQMN